MPTRSAIPHLARAIAEKRGLAVWRANNTRLFPPRTPCCVPSHRSSMSSRIPPIAPKSRTKQQSSVNWPAQLTDVKDEKGARTVSVQFKATMIFAFSIGLYCTYLYVNWTTSIKRHAMSDDYLPFNADVSSRWKELGRDYDDEVEMSEKLMSMKQKRRRLVQRAYGNVLEVSVGTGRNLNYYDMRPFDPVNPARRNIITHLTLNDQSGVIIAAAEDKLEKLMSRQEKPLNRKVDFTVGDAGVSGVIDRPEGGFDTIVQTMGVCSMVDPVGFLRRMGQLCRQPGEKSKIPERWRMSEDDGKGGQILLLEHGKGYFDWLNWILDTGASLHAHRFGCWWNKDIERIIKQSGLEVEKIKRYHGGTTWMIILRPKNSTTINSEKDKAQVQDTQVVSQRHFGG